jgi:hypothetical protein
MSSKPALLVGGVLVVGIGAYLLVAGRSGRNRDVLEKIEDKVSRPATPPVSPGGATGGHLTAAPPPAAGASGHGTQTPPGDGAVPAEPKVAIPAGPPSQDVRARLHLDARERQVAMYRTELSGMRDRVEKLTRKLVELKRENKVTPEQERQIQRQIQGLSDAEPRLKRHLEELERPQGAAAAERQNRKAAKAARSAGSQ